MHPASRVVVVRAAGNDKVVVIGLAADSGCGKSTFMRRVTGIFGGDPKAPEGGNPDSNTLLSDMTTVICLDDYHSLDRNGRKQAAVTALDPKAQHFDLMYEQVSGGDVSWRECCTRIWPMLGVHLQACLFIGHIPCSVQPHKIYTCSLTGVAMHAV